MGTKRPAQQTGVAAKKAKAGPKPLPKDKTITALQKLLPQRSLTALKPVGTWLEKECQAVTFADLEGLDSMADEVITMMNDSSLSIGSKGIVKELLKVLAGGVGADDDDEEEEEPAEEEEEPAEEEADEEEEEEPEPVKKMVYKKKAVPAPNKVVVNAGSAGVKRSSAVNAMRTAVAEGREMPGAERIKERREASLAAAEEALSRPFEKCFMEQPPLMNEAELAVLDEARAEMEVIVHSDEGKNFAPVTTFEELGCLPEYVMAALAAMGIEAPLPIQSQALPLVLAGHDVTGIAKTGSGKTLAYLLPAIVHIEAQDAIEEGHATPICVALAPTRELVVQIAEEAMKLVAGSTGASSHPGGLSGVCVFGGKSKFDQIQQMKRGCHILAATPGRLMDCVENGDIHLNRTTFFILDEADRMLEEGFADHLKIIANHIRKDRHMLFFSATWPKEVENLAAAMCLDEQKPIHLAVGQREDGIATTRASILQEVVVFTQAGWDERDAAKRELLYNHIREVLSNEENKMLVFVSSKVLADELKNALWGEGFHTDSMHGGKTQDARLNVLERFKHGETRMLVCTDVMGRGLDIPDISHVVIYDMGDVDDYVHRIGRTARGPTGQGHALTLFEFDKKWPKICEGLVKVLETSEQEVPDELRHIADEVARTGTFSGFKNQPHQPKRAGSGPAIYKSQAVAKFNGWDKSSATSPEETSMAEMLWSMLGGGEKDQAMQIAKNRQSGKKWNQVTDGAKGCKWCEKGECYSHGQIEKPKGAW